MAAPSVSLPDLIECVDRELGFRVKVYPRWVNKNPPKMTPQAMNREIDRMRAVRARLLQSAALDILVEELAKEAGVAMPDFTKRLEDLVALQHAQFQKCP